MGQTPVKAPRIAGTGSRESSRDLERILILSNYYYPFYRGGYTLSCKSVTDELIRRGYDIKVLTSNWRAREKVTSGYVHRLLHARQTAGSNPFYRRWQHLQLAVFSRIDYRIARRLIEELAPDVVYVWNMGHLALSPLKAIQDLGFPFVFDLGDYWLLQKFEELWLEPDTTRKAYRLFLHGLDSFDPAQFPHLLTGSDVLKQSYVQAGVPPESITVIPRGLRADVIVENPAPRPEDQNVKLLFAGRLDRKKGVHLALEAVALLNTEFAPQLHRPVSLDVVGSGDPQYTGELRHLVASLGLQSLVRFLGHLLHDKVIELYAEYDAVLVPAIWVEPFGRVAVEAMARGTCVIASDRGGPAEIITHGHDGLLVTPEDPQAIARAVVTLVQDRNLAERIRQAAVATVREQYSLEKVVDRIEVYLTDVARRNTEQVRATQ